MKKKRIYLLSLLLAGSLFVLRVTAQNPPPPPNNPSGGGSNPPVGGGTPIGEGMVVLTLLASGYALLKGKQQFPHNPQ